jgi:phosphate transport system substrate-binding protein
MTDADRAKRLQDVSYARTPIAFVTHPGVALQGITLTEVAQVFSGRILAWPNGMPVRVIRRDPSDADWTMLRTLSADMVEAVQIALQRPGLLTAATDQDNADALERLPGSFGAMSIGQVRAENRRVVPLILDGAPPTAEAVAEGRYGLVRTLHAVWHDGPNPDLLRFLAFLRSGQTAELLTRLGHIAHVGPDA